jgi:hypothetical protein
MDRGIIYKKNFNIERYRLNNVKEEKQVIVVARICTGKFDFYSVSWQTVFRILSAKCFKSGAPLKYYYDSLAISF